MRKNAFTLIELLIVVAIIGILAAIAVPNFLNAQARATLARIQGDHQAIVTAVEMYAADNGAYPGPELASDLQGGVTTWPYYIPDRLIEPTSYIGTVKIQDPLGRPNGGNEIISRYRFKVFNMETRPDLPGKDSPGAREANKVLGQFMIVSHGPNRWLDLPQNFADGRNPTDWFWLPFDPSNGLLAPGDLIRGQSGIPTGYPGYDIQWRVSKPRSQYETL